MNAWWCNAFVGPESCGNLQVVVNAEPGPTTEVCASIARALRAPDTAFLCERGGDLTARFFSPLEGEMVFCGQALVAIDAVWRAAHPVPEAEPLSVITASGLVRLTRDAQGLSWFHAGRDAVRELPCGASLAELSEGLAGAEPPRVVDSGRRRLFQCMDLRTLEAAELDPRRVLDFCGRHQLKGVCLWAPAEGRRFRLRVFTISFGGKEDASTGGAVLGLGALLGGEETVEILQGHGHALDRGHLFLRPRDAAGEIAVGGRVEVVARGQVEPRTR